MADWSNSRRHDATDVHHASQDVGGFCTYSADPAMSHAWNKVMSFLANLGYHVSCRRQCASGAPNRASAVRHAALGGRSYIRRGWGTSGSEEARVLALSYLVGHWNKLRKRWYVPESDGREGGGLRQGDEPYIQPNKPFTHLSLVGEGRS